MGNNGGGAQPFCKVHSRETIKKKKGIKAEFKKGNLGKKTQLRKFLDTKRTNGRGGGNKRVTCH